MRWWPTHWLPAPLRARFADAAAPDHRFADQLLAGLRARPHRGTRVRDRGAKDAHRVLAGELRLRTGSTVRLGPDFAVDWTTPFASRRSSNLLHFFSLEYVAGLLAAHEADGDERYLQAAVGIVRSFLDHLDASLADRTAILQLRGSDSNDHATSKRTSVLLDFAATLLRLEREPALARRTAALLHVHMRYLLDDRNYVGNNHGVMADLALAELGMALGAEAPDGRACIDKANGRLCDAVTRIFDADGYAFENTIGYHRFNLALFRSALERFSACGIGGRFAEVAPPILARADEALRYCVWPDGGIPPIGDSQVFRKAAKSIDRPRLFAESHFAVIKSPEFYLSFVCGRRGKSHKHVDDTSVTLRFAGRDVLIDGGAYNYDGEDPYRRCLSSSFGHSGIFPERLESLQRRDYHRLQPEARIVEWTEHPRGVVTAGEVRFPAWGILVQRRIEVRWPGAVLIEDSVTAEGGSSDITARQAWLLGQEATVTHDAAVEGVRVVLVKTGDVEASFRLGCAGGEPMDKAYRGVQAPPYRGWCSQARGQVAPTTELARYLTGRRLRFRAEIALTAARPS
ncbi:hypothetical protein HK414_14795 [Ramlibacter terrae]|uniref:Heparinase II/III-like C-terminal domain-containing protein n=1 Tax=Ramlibacter terrae TaxID=2732511 RepID=A0ABX6P693_9BURK|nr:hypothetical protein HK414_14795 [Ramlibacter terrae]